MRKCRGSSSTHSKHENVMQICLYFRGFHISKRIEIDFHYQSRHNFILLRNNECVNLRREYKIHDPIIHQQVNKLNGHSARVGALAWNSDILSSGSRDRLIMQRDTRTPPQTCERRLEGHRQEVCGLKWSPGEITLRRFED